MLPLWQGVGYQNFNADSENHVLLKQSQAAALLPKATWTHSSISGWDDYLYMTFVKKEKDGGLRYGLSVFLPIREARQEPALQEFISSYYGGKWDLPETREGDRLIVQ